jgi:large subunit ribosomal protein L17
MRHRKHHRKLNRTSEHRKALHRNLAQSLIEHGQVTTTLPKARDIRPYVERLVTLAVRTRKLAGNDPAASLIARRRLHRLLGDRSIIPSEHQDAYDDMSDATRTKTRRMASGRRHRTGQPRGRLAFTAESVTHRLLETIAPRFEDRSGGYTRLIRLADRRKGDQSGLAVVQFVGDEEAPTSLTKPRRSARHRRADARYAAAIKAGKSRGKDKGKVSAEEPKGANADAVQSAMDSQPNPSSSDAELQG